MVEIGLCPWWLDPRFKASFWKPITVLTHVMDYRLWPGAPSLMHAQSIFWFASAAPIASPTAQADDVTFVRLVFLFPIVVGVGQLADPIIDVLHGLVVHHPHVDDQPSENVMAVSVLGAVARRLKRFVAPTGIIE